MRQYDEQKQIDPAGSENGEIFIIFLWFVGNSNKEMGRHRNYDSLGSARNFKEA